MLYQVDNTGNYNFMKKPATTVYEKRVKDAPGDADRYDSFERDTRYVMTPNMLFPRMYSSAPNHPTGYLEWTNLRESDLPLKEEGNKVKITLRFRGRET